MKNRLINFIVKKLGGYTPYEYFTKPLKDTERDLKSIQSIMDRYMDARFLEAFPPVFVKVDKKIQEEVMYPGAVLVIKPEEWEPSTNHSKDL